MRRVLAAILIVSLGLPACAARGTRAGGVDRSAPSPSDTAAWRQFAAGLPPGTALNVRLTTGERFAANLVLVDERAMVVDRRTRIPEPLQRVEFHTIAHLAVRQTGATLGRAAAVGAGVGVGSFLGFLLLVTAVWDD